MKFKKKYLPHLVPEPIFEYRHLFFTKRHCLHISKSINQSVCEPASQAANQPTSQSNLYSAPSRSLLRGVSGPDQAEKNSLVKVMELRTGIGTYTQHIHVLTCRNNLHTHAYIMDTWVKGRP